MKITEYPSLTDLKEDNVFLFDGPDGTKIIKKSDFVYAMFDSIPAMHRQIYRGKNLGNTVTSTQSDNIKNGTFHDIWVGDYWEIGGMKYYVADFDLYYGSFRNPSLSHHVVVWPGDKFGTEQFITTANTNSTNGYGESNIRKALHGSTGNTEAYTTITSAFSSHILTYSEFLCQGLNQGTIGDLDTTGSSKEYTDCSLELPTVSMLTGGSAITQTMVSVFPTGGVLVRSPMALFLHDPLKLKCESNPGTAYWSRDYDWRLPRQYNAYFTGDNVNGLASNSFSGVRPFFLVA